jgi:dTDP-4-dehydrorhamnose 3,5-epimerase
MEIIELNIKGLYEINLSPITDHRGFFMRTYDYAIFKEKGIDKQWIQENHSGSIKKGTIRGLHFQFYPFTETKMIRCIKGEIFDVAVDLRKDSETFGKWESVILSESNKKAFYIPRGFAHGFCTLTENCEVVYKTDNYYNKSADAGILWCDKALGINWPVNEPILSEKDAKLPGLEFFSKEYIGL